MVGMKDKMVIVFLVAALLVALFSLSSAESDIKEGYDENTELTIRGTVIETVREMGGPVILRLKARAKTYRVITAPPWYLSQEAIAFSSGSEVEVVGSKYIGRDGDLYIIAREIRETASGRVVVLRDESYRPLWKGHRMHNRRM